MRAAAPEGVDVALDTIGTDEAVDVSLELVEDKDRIATVAAFGRAGDAGIQLLGNGPGADPGTEIRADAWRHAGARHGRARPERRLTRTYPLAEAADALAFVPEGHAGGKVVLLP